MLAALPANYEQQDYAAQVYTHRRFTNFDTLRYEAEYVSQVLEPAGHRDFNGGFLMMGPRQKHRVQEVRKIEESKRPVRMTDLMVSGQGFLSSAMDPVRISPLFKEGRWRKYTREQIKARGDNLDIRWLKDDNPETAEAQRDEPAMVACLVMRELTGAMADLRSLLEELGEDPDAMLEDLLAE